VRPARVHDLDRTPTNLILTAIRDSRTKHWDGQFERNLGDRVAGEYPGLHGENPGRTAYALRPDNYHELEKI
jgi:hypothetical protein